MSQNVDTLRKGYEDFARGDVAAVLAVFDPEIEWTVPTSIPFLGGSVNGHDGVLAFFQSIPAHVEELVLTPERFVDGGDTVVVLGTDTGRAAGGSYSVPFAHVWTFRDGKAVRFEEHTDTATLAQVLQPAAVRA